jgi:hypothetical protein
LNKIKNEEGKKKLIEWCEKNKINRNFVLWAEKLILINNLEKHNLKTPFDIIEIIQLKLKLLLKFSSLKIENFINITNSFIQFSLHEYLIYKKYNQVIITFACLLIGISDFDNGENSEEENKKNKNIIKNFIKELDFIDLGLIEECEKDILSVINNNSDDDEEFEITRANSLNSFSEALNNNEKMKEDKINLDISNRFSTASNEDNLD